MTVDLSGILTCTVRHFFCSQLFVVSFNYFLVFTSAISSSSRIAVVLRPIDCVRIVLCYARMAQSSVFCEFLLVVNIEIQFHCELLSSF